MEGPRGAGERRGMRPGSFRHRRRGRAPSSRVSKCSQIRGANSCLPYRRVLSQTVLETPTDVVFVVLALSCPELRKKKL